MTNDNDKHQEEIAMALLNSKNFENLTKLVNSNSKHSNYQILHPSLLFQIKIDYEASGKKELERQQYMSEKLQIQGLRLLDIGANTGYFSFAAVAEGAAKVICAEGNTEHAEFIKAAANFLGITDKISVQNAYFNFQKGIGEKFDTILCLNVLHHLGDDFGDQDLTIEQAKLEMISNLNSLATHTNKLWLQIGFNWRGDRTQPLFKNGTKLELIDFIRLGITDFWTVDDISTYDPLHKKYKAIDSNNSSRIDSIGEFLNRPLFLMTSKIK
jgi:SAM-dependent methyltransferase